ncbi:hypothetical protein E2C01_101212 [Portunus trituberculatus]|uniref:Uncharacterized protein n=1 Tax=Portunus trituberculatus TaxID=210409 RepID=A0A5B7KF18_PORTR|nr:hypothetical protein [Portunus trituberculatus]
MKTRNCRKKVKDTINSRLPEVNCQLECKDTRSSLIAQRWLQVKVPHTPPSEPQPDCSKLFTRGLRNCYTEFILSLYCR